MEQATLFARSAISPFWRKKLQLIYKYYGFEAGLLALKDKTLGFNTPSHFNDPMEGRLWLHQRGVESGFLNTFLENIGILCLTRNPLNPLMWSHYGQHHTGFVIGYDVNEPILGAQRDSVFSVEDGQVFYSAEFDADNIQEAADHALRWAICGMDEPRSERIVNSIRHILLMKQECRRYEQETRVVKVLTNYLEEQHDWVSATGNNFRRLSTTIAPMASMSNSGLHLLNVAPASIKRVILGMKNPLLQEDANVHADADLTYIREGQAVLVDKAVWSCDGNSLEAVEANVSAWEKLNVIDTKMLNSSELAAISEKLLAAPNPSEQGMRLTTWLDGNVEAFWDDEL